MTDIRAIFRRAYNGHRNFMTPELVGYGQQGQMVWELSKGRGMSTEQLYGVTVIELPNIKRFDLSTCFKSQADAMAYIRNDFQEVSK